MKPKIKSIKLIKLSNNFLQKLLNSPTPKLNQIIKVGSGAAEIFGQMESSRYL